MTLTKSAYNFQVAIWTVALLVVFSSARDSASARTHTTTPVYSEPPGLLPLPDWQDTDAYIQRVHEGIERLVRKQNLDREQLIREGEKLLLQALEQFAESRYRLYQEQRCTVTASFHGSNGTRTDKFEFIDWNGDRLPYASKGDRLFEWVIRAPADGWVVSESRMEMKRLSGQSKFMSGDQMVRRRDSVFFTFHVGQPGLGQTRPRWDADIFVEFQRSQDFIDRQVAKEQKDLRLAIETTLRLIDPPTERAWLGSGRVFRKVTEGWEELVDGNLKNRYDEVFLKPVYAELIHPKTKQEIRIYFDRVEIKHKSSETFQTAYRGAWIK